MNRFLIVILLMWFCLIDGAMVAGANPATHPSLRAANLPQLISVEEFHQGYDTWGHRLSPDGKRLAWIPKRHREPAIYVRLVDSGYTFKLHTLMAIHGFKWAADSRHLLFTHRLPNRPSNTHLFVLDSKSLQSLPRNLTPFRNTIVQWYVSLPRRPDTILVEMKLRNDSVFKLYEVNLLTGDNKSVWTGGQSDDERRRQWFIDQEGTVVGQFLDRPDGSWILQVFDGVVWRSVFTGTSVDEMYPVGFNLKVGDYTVYSTTNTGRDKMYAAALNLKTGRQQVLLEPVDTDVDEFLIDTQDYVPIAAGYHDSLPRYRFFSTGLGEDLRKIFGKQPIVYEFLSTGPEDMKLTMLAETDTLAPSVYLIDRRSGRKEILSEHPLAKYKKIFSRKRPITIEARDGLRLSGYLTLPHGTNGRKLPLVLKVHGGPHERDLWRFGDVTQFLANRGYAVLEVNFRGSSGFGKKFKEKACGEYGRKMQDDLIDAVAWAVAEGYADREKIAIYGLSYGGYATLMALTRTPRRFAAGIAGAGVSDLSLFVANLPRKLQRSRSWWIRCVGDPQKPDERKELVDRSPITHAHLIQRPLLIIHGGKDSVVPKEQSDRLVDELRRADLPFDYLVLPDAGHSISHRKYRIAVFRQLEVFLAKHLGGRTEAPE